MQNSQTTTTNNNGEWVQSCVKDLTYHPQYGWTTSAKNLPNGLKLLRTTDISKEQVNWDMVPVCTIEPNEKDKYLIREEDILVSRAGSIGLSYYVQNPPPAVFASYLIRFRALPDKIRAKLLYYFFQSPSYWSAIGAGELGIAIPNVNATKLGEIEVSYPTSFDEQDKLIARLDYLLPKVTNTKNKVYKAKKIINKFRQSVLSAAVTGKLTEEWREKNKNLESAESLLQKIKTWRFEKSVGKTNRDKIEATYAEIKSNTSDIDNELEIPDTWVHCKIDHIGQVANGSTPSRKMPSYWKGEIPWVSSGEVINSVITETREKITKEGFNNASVKMLPVDTVLLAMIGEGKTRGQTSILKIEATTNQNIAAIVIDHKQVIPEYLWYWFRMQYLATRHQGSGSGPQALSCARVKELPFVLPPLLEQIEIVRQLDQLFKITEAVKSQIEKAENKTDKLTQSILAKAFRGEL